jgi:AcrR family transcriptional regulator
LQQCGDALLRKRGHNYSNRIRTSRHVGVAQTRTNHSTRERILATTLELTERAEGAEGVTMRRVATWVGVTAMAIYKHLRDREALLSPM